MILELVYIEGITMNPQSQSNIQTISYENSSDLMSELNKIEAGCKYTTLVIWGGHGSKTEMCGLNASELVRIVAILKEKGFTFDTIVLDACETALHAKTFKDLLSKEGRILCHLGICGAQILNTDRQGVTDRDIRQRWWHLISNAYEESVNIALFPCVLLEEAMYHLHIDGTPFETSDINPFTEACLKGNQDNVKSTEVKSFTEFQRYIFD